MMHCCSVCCTQLLSFVHKAAPRGIYTSGKGSSAVGLTASVIRDPETRDLVLVSMTLCQLVCLAAAVLDVKLLTRVHTCQSKLTCSEHIVQLVAIHYNNNVRPLQQDN